MERPNLVRFRGRLVLGFLRVKLDSQLVRYIGKSSGSRFGSLLFAYGDDAAVVADEIYRLRSWPW